MCYNRKCQEGVAQEIQGRATLKKVQEVNIIHHVVKPNVERESEFDLSACLYVYTETLNKQIISYPSGRGSKSCKKFAKPLDKLLKVWYT